jgi:ribosomal protein S18 acetylase RimI-like enzyme
MTAPAIRSATPRDAVPLAGLRYDFRGGLDPVVEAKAVFVERCAAWMRRRLKAGGDWRCWVADAAGAIVGTVWLGLVEKLPNPIGEPEWHGYVSSLYVRPEYRGMGLGSALLDTCLRECETRPVDAVVLWPTPASRTLYLRHGFEVREDLMERRLWTSPDHRGEP